MAREQFGIIDQQRSGNYRARYTGPDKKRYPAPTTFKTKGAARAWLVLRQAEIAAGTWVPPEVAAAQAEQEAREAARRDVTLAFYAAKWITTRTNSRGEPLRPRTVEAYERLLRAEGTKNAEDKGGPLAPLVDLKLGEITPEGVREWRAAQIETGRLTQTSRAYDLLKSILKTAVEDQLIERNPCTVKGGSTTSTGKKVEPPTDEQLRTIVNFIDPRYTALVIIAASGGLRWGEATELRAKDITVELDAAGEVDCVRITVDRQVVHTKKAGRDVGAVKSLAGVRKLAIFGKDAQRIAEHIEGKAGDDLLFTNAAGTSWLPQSAFWRHWHKAVKLAKRPDLPFHGLRHYAGTRYAQSGATLKETMTRLGHSSVKAAMRYQAAGNRDDELARRAAR